MFLILQVVPPVRVQAASPRLLRRPPPPLPPGPVSPTSSSTAVLVYDRTLRPIPTSWDIGTSRRSWMMSSLSGDLK